VDRLKRIYGYLKRNPDGAIRFRTGIPDHESREPPVKYDWINSVYGPNPEELPTNMPPPLGNMFRTTTYEDANLVHCLVTGRSMSGIIHLVNQTPIQWFCKKQNVVETSTYGSEFMVARQATEQIMDLRYTLRMMGIPLDGPAWMFGDNQSVITSSNIPHSNLNKRHNALSYHRVREAISAGILYFLHIDGKLNPSDILTKFLAWAKFWPLIQPMLFWKGETIKHIHPNLPITQAIQAIALAASSGLRGVSTKSSISPSDAAKKSTVKSLLTGRSALPSKVVADHDYPSTARRVRFKDFPATSLKDSSHSTVEKPQESLGDQVPLTANQSRVPPENSSVDHHQASGSAITVSADVSESTEVVETRTSDVAVPTDTLPGYTEAYTNPMTPVGSYKENPWILVKGVKGMHRN
jgi:hypothetical protein